MKLTDLTIDHELKSLLPSGSDSGRAELLANREAMVNGDVAVSNAANIHDLPMDPPTEAVTAVRMEKATTATKAAEREPGDETNPESDKLNELTEKMRKGSEKLMKDMEGCARAADDMAAKSPPFKQRHKRYMNLLSDLYDKAKALKEDCAKFEKGWIECRKQIEG